MPLPSQRELFKRYNLEREYYEEVRKHWVKLREIYDDYIDARNTLDMHIPLVVGPLTKKVPQVHSIRYRLKDPVHLVEKVIRKKLWENITLENYKREITDLVGVRVLHLFKADWMYIHRYIVDSCQLKEDPVANVREGDSEELTGIYKDAGCTIHKHPAGYRSVHYLVKTPANNDDQAIEIQVRTIFEEGWSEIDHHFRYPYDRNNAVIRSFIDILNRTAGSADEIGTFLKDLDADSKLGRTSHANHLVKRRTAVENKKMDTTQSKIVVKEKPLLNPQPQNETLALRHDRMLERQIEIIRRALHRRTKGR